MSDLISKSNKKPLEVPCDGHIFKKRNFILIRHVNREMGKKLSTSSCPSPLHTLTHTPPHAPKHANKT